MSQFTNPSEIARETLRLLAARRIAPTPDHYRQYYREVAGEPEAASDAGAERMLAQLAAELRAQPGKVRSCEALAQAAAERDWEQCRGIFLDLLGSKSDQETGAAQWAQLILELLKQWETRHNGFTVARKREGLERVLGVPGSDSARLAAKLRKLVSSWAMSGVESAGAVALADAPISEPESAAAPENAGAPQSAGAPAAAGEAAIAELRELLAQTLEFALVAQLRHAPELAEEASRLAKAARAAADKEAMEQLARALRQFWYKLELRGGGDAELHQGLLRLLRLLIDNTEALLSEDRWLSGQVAVLKEIVARPLDIDSIGEAERRLKDVIFKQGTLRDSLQEAKSALKQLIGNFIDRLGALSESTDGYHNRLEDYARKIRQADDIKQLNVVLADLLTDTNSTRLAAARTRDELIAARRQVETAESKVRELELELEQVSGLAHEDQLTGVLNRRGLDDAFQRETARAERGATPLCIGLLDIDNFKLLNDTHGHQTGDEALQHLVRVTRRTMRPSDVLARYGGEEFLLLLPETQPDAAVEVMVRLQRNLTKAFFLHNNERLLITFSAGVTLHRPGEPQSEVIERADQALYRAKRAGKNRVCAG